MPSKLKRSGATTQDGSGVKVHYRVNCLNGDHNISIPISIEKHSTDPFVVATPSNVY